MDKLTHAVFAFALLTAALAIATDPVGAIHLTLVYLFFAIIAFNQYDYHERDGISPLFSLQVGLAFALGIAIVTLVVGGLGVRTLELIAVFGLVLAVVLARDDLSTVLPAMLPYLAAFAVLLGIFLYHGREFAANTGLGLFPVLAGIILAINLFVVPRYVSQDAVYWTVAVLTAGIAAVGIPTVIYGDVSVWIFEIRTWGGDVSPGFIDREIPVVRSIFANPNTFGLLMFPGTVASVVASRRTLARSSLPALAVVPLCCLPVTAIGLYLSSSRASMFAAALAIAIYAAYVLGGRHAVPLALLTIAVAVPAFLLGVYLSILPIDPANRFTIWRAGIEALGADGSLLGQGLISTREAIAPYLDGATGTYTSHNSYLSIAIRAGFLGALAYLALVVGPVVHGLVRADRVNVPMLALATGFAIHQLFEGYTLYQVGPGSVLGALAVGYVIASLAAPTDRPAETAARADVADPWPDAEPFGYRQDRNGADRHDRRS